MPRDFLPSRDAELLGWAASFAAKVVATPTEFGLSAGQATAFQSSEEAFATALAAATDPATRTKGIIAAKNAARDAMKSAARDLARIIQAHPGLSDQQRYDLGLTVRKQPSPIPPPNECPVLTVLRTNNRTVHLRARSADSNHRGKPPQIDGITIFSHVGSAPPADISGWKFEGSTTRVDDISVEFPSSVPAGSQVWICGFWYSPRALSGPACQGISAYLAGGVTGSPTAEAVKESA